MTLYLKSRDLTSLPSIPSHITRLDCTHNRLTKIDNLPSSLIDLCCGNNPLTRLVIPTSLTYLDCNVNYLSSIENLDNGNLRYLDISYNKFEKLKIPKGVIECFCYGNGMTKLENLSRDLQMLHCASNRLTSLPTLPNSCIHLHCYDNLLTTLPRLPPSLKVLFCSGNAIEEPELPLTLVRYQFNGNYYRISEISSILLRQHNQKRIALGMEQVDSIKDWEWVREQWILFQYRVDGEIYKLCERSLQI